MILVIVVILGCGKSQPPATLVIHAHHGVYDFIDPNGNHLKTADNLNDFEMLLKKDEIQKLIRGNRVIVRFEGTRTSDGNLTVPDELTPVLAKLAGAGVLRQDFDYTND